jgi:hypothetical protein
MSDEITVLLFFNILFLYTVSDKIKTTYGFDLGDYLVILAIFSQYFT